MTDSPQREIGDGATEAFRSAYTGGLDASHSSRHGIAEAHASERNRLLASLSLDDYDRVLPELRPVRLSLRAVLVEVNVPITDVWFIRSGLGSMLAVEQRGGSVEVGTVGREGLVGLPILHAVDRSGYEMIVAVEGDAWRMGAETFRRIIDERPRMRRLCLRYAQCFHDQVAQAVACNRLHTLEQRCARWLLATRDRVDDDTFALTQDFLATMLGVRRAGVSVAMSEFQRDGMLRYARGRVTLLDRAKLEAASCDCYGITRHGVEGIFAVDPLAA